MQEPRREVPSFLRQQGTGIRTVTLFVHIRLPDAKVAVAADSTPRFSAGIRNIARLTPPPTTMWCQRQRR